MESKPLGSTGLPVSRVGLGLASLGRPGYINLGHGTDTSDGRDRPAMKARAFQVLDEAWRLGVRYYDVARSYGEAESFLGAWLVARSIAPDAVTIGSKWGYTYTAAWAVEADRHEVKDHSLRTLTRQWSETQATLKPYLKLYQIHSATLESGVLADRRVLNELARLKASGIKVGLSLTGPAQAETLRRALDVEVEGRPLFDAVQATWNLLERSIEPALVEANRRGLGVIVKEALANGRLTSRNEGRSKLLDEQAGRLGTLVDALALSSVLARPWAEVVLSGAGTSDQLRSNLRALEVRWDDEAEETLASIVEASNEYWATRARLPWN